jgi:predicted short-subunit dehydrogenase-like oxidoreductase (DUF2520 family)
MPFIPSETSNDLTGFSLAVVGRGRLGTALTSALRAAGHDVAGPSGRNADVGPADVVILCVPDVEVAAVANTLGERTLVGHTSGALTLENLGARQAFSMHPLLPIVGENTSFVDAYCAVSGNTDLARSTASGLARSLGMRSFEVADDLRPLYHAAASLASNYIVSVLDVAEQLFRRAGLSRSPMIPLSLAAVNEWALLGGDRALTGPIVRGDDDTVARQRAAIAQRAPEFVEIWDVLTAATRTLADRARASDRPSPSAP